MLEDNQLAEANKKLIGELNKKTAIPLYILTVVNVITKIDEEALRGDYDINSPSHQENGCLKANIRDTSAAGKQLFDHWIEEPFDEQFHDDYIMFWEGSEIGMYSGFCRHYTPFEIRFYDHSYFIDEKTAKEAAVFYSYEFSEDDPDVYAVVRREPIRLHVLPCVSDFQDVYNDHTTFIYRYDRNISKCILLTDKEIKQDECAMAVYQHFALNRQCIEKTNNTI